MSQSRLVRVALLKKPYIDHVGAQLSVVSGWWKSAFATKREDQGGGSTCKVLAFGDKRVSGVLRKRMFNLGLVTSDYPHFGQPSNIGCSEI
jgi:hypothetical protein